MHIELLVEEPSAEAALMNILPEILPVDATYQIHLFSGKQDLLKKLPDRLRGYRKWLLSDWRVIVLLDEDREDCKKLKQSMEKMALESKLATKSSPLPNGRFQVVNRIAIEELEAWFFGDNTALKKAYSKISETLHKKEPYRNPDTIQGGTWEALERVFQRAGYYRGGMPKIEVARNVSKFMDPGRNLSRSFQIFLEGVRACLA